MTATGPGRAAIRCVGRTWEKEEAKAAVEAAYRELLASHPSNARAVQAHAAGLREQDHRFRNRHLGLETRA